MAFNDGLYWFKNVLKKQLSIAARIYLSIALIISPIFFMNDALANTNLGGWTITNRAMQGASRVYDAAKTAVINGANVAKTSTAKYTPTASQVAKGIGRVGAAAAVAAAISALIGGVDYVMDPANNRVKYYDTPDAIDPPLLFLEPYGKAHVRGSQACAALESYQMGNGYWVKVHSMKLKGSGSFYYCEYVIDLSDGRKNVESRYQLQIVGTTEIPEPEEKYLPYEQIAQKIIGDAAGGNAQAQEFVGGVADWELDNTSSVRPPIVQQFEANAKTQTKEQAEADTKVTPNPETGGYDLKLEFPAFCGWAPVVCQAAQVAINFPSMAQGWVSDLMGTSQELKGELVNNGQKIGAVQGELVNNGQKVDAVKGELVNNGQKVDAVKGELINNGEKIDTVTGELINNGQKVEQAAADTVAAIEAAGAANVEKLEDVKTGVLDTLTNWWDVAVNAATAAWQQVKDWVQEASDYFKEDPPVRDKETLDINDLDVNASSVSLSASNACPSDSVSFSLAGQNVRLEMPYKPVCDALNFFRPAVLVVGAIASVYIVSGVRNKEDE